MIYFTVSSFNHYQFYFLWIIFPTTFIMRVKNAAENAFYSLIYREIILNRFLINMLFAFKSPQSPPHPAYEIEKNFLRSTYKW